MPENLYPSKRFISCKQLSESVPVVRRKQFEGSIGNTPLHLAIEGVCFDIARLLSFLSTIHGYLVGDHNLLICFHLGPSSSSGLPKTFNGTFHHFREERFVGFANEIFFYKLGMAYLIQAEFDIAHCQ